MQANANGSVGKLDDERGRTGRGQPSGRCVEGPYRNPEINTYKYAVLPFDFPNFARTELQLEQL